MVNDICFEPELKQVRITFVYNKHPETGSGHPQIAWDESSVGHQKEDPGRPESIPLTTEVP